MFRTNNLIEEKEPGPTSQEESMEVEQPTSSLHSPSKELRLPNEIDFLKETRICSSLPGAAPLPATVLQGASAASTPAPINNIPKSPKNTAPLPAAALQGATAVSTHSQISNLSKSSKNKNSKSSKPAQRKKIIAKKRLPLKLFRKKI